MELRNNGNTLDLGIIKSLSNRKESGIMNMPMPMSDSTDAMMMDLMGCSRDISIRGTKVGEEEELKTFIQQINSILNGRQTASKLTDRFGIEYDVLIKGFSFEDIEARPTEIEYTLELTEGTSIL